MGKGIESSEIKKFTAPRSALCSAIGKVVGAVDSRSTLPILNFIKMTFCLRGAVVIAASDLEIFVTAECEIEIIDGGCDICVPAKKIKGALDSIDSEIVSIVVENMQMTVSGNSLEYAFECLPAAEYPAPPETSDNEIVEFTPEALPKILRAVGHAAGKDAVKFNLCGVHFQFEKDIEQLTAVATDGHRISVAGIKNIPGAKNIPTMTIPSKACVLVSAINGTLCLSQTEGVAGFSSPGVEVVARLIDGDYPEYRGVIPKDYDLFTTIDKQSLIDAVEAICVMSDGSGKSIFVEVSDCDFLLVSAVGSSGKSKALIPYKGDALAVHISAKYLLMALKALDGDEVFIKHKSPLHPLVLFPSDSGIWDERFEMIMPMRAQ